MLILKCLLWTSVVQSQDLKLSGWVSCSEWSCEKPIQEGIARLNFIGVKERSKYSYKFIERYGFMGTMVRIIMNYVERPLTIWIG